MEALRFPSIGKWNRDFFQCLEKSVFAFLPRLRSGQARLGKVTLRGVGRCGIIRGARGNQT